MFLKKLLTGTIAIAAVGMLLTGCDPENPPEPGVTDPTPTEGSAPAPGGQVTEAGFIARLEDAPGPGEPNKTENYVYTTSDYQRIHDTYGIDIISLTNPYISLEGPEENAKVNSLSSFNTPENKDRVVQYAANNHSDWSLTDENPESCTYIYYENGILSGIYPSLKYNFGDNYVLLDPVYDRIIDGSKQTMHAYIYGLVEECAKDFSGITYEIEFKENDILCFAENTSLKDAFNVYCAYVDQGSSLALNNLYGMDYLHHYVYGYTGDGFSAGYDALGFSGIDSNNSKFLNIFFNASDTLSDDAKIQEAYSNYTLPTYLFGEIDEKLAEFDIYPFYDRYVNDTKNWEADKDYNISSGIEAPTIEFYMNFAALESRVEHKGSVLTGLSKYGQRFLPKNRVE